MEVIKLRMAGKRLPDGAAEIGSPVAGKMLGVCFFNIEIFSVFSFGIFDGFLKPLVFIRAVVDHEIHQNVHFARMRLLQKRIHFLQRSEAGIDILIIADVIALIREGRGIDRREPENIHAEIL